MKRYFLAAAALAMLAPAAMAQTMTVKGPGYWAIGTGSKAEKTTDGHVKVDNGKATKTCAADQIAVASTLKTTIKTLNDETTYPDGLVACLDPAAFGGAASVDFGQGTADIRPAGTK